MYEIKYASIYMITIFIGIFPIIMISLIISLIKGLKSRPTKKGRKKKGGISIEAIKEISLGSDEKAIEGALNTFDNNFMDLSKHNADEVINVLANFAKNSNSKIEKVTQTFSALQGANPSLKNQINDVVGKALKARK